MKTCKVKVSLLKDTPFYCKKTSILDILLVIKLWSFKVKQTAICEFLGISQKCIRHIINKTLSIVENTVYNLTGKIGGPGIIVEIDESKFGKVKYHKGHRVDGVWVFGMVERTTQRKIVMIPVDNRRADTLEEIIKNYVHRESIIHSDCFKSYSKLKDIFAERKTVNHSIEFVNNINSCHTNTIEGNWFGIKNETSVRHRTRTLISGSLIRFMLRRNFKGDVFTNIIKFIFSSFFPF
ncbi:DDE-TNP-IS1595 domain-containing protein [Vairimorpha necatrix]|uniref:DDE-TNP-IS1595 domain-containing protein n=1 Tax=Vairimorpha necatrix TaxID=6039 RepID=A0AAX4JGJ6_9MICR